MIRAFRAWIAVATLAIVGGCGDGDSQLAPRPEAYKGPPITQVVIKKADRKMYLISGADVVRTYDINLGNQPVGAKRFEGDGKTPEGAYFIDRKNPNSKYHLSVGISYPSVTDIAYAAQMGLRPGGDIMIHGQGPDGRRLNRPDWTAGCIAITDAEIEEVFSLLKPGVAVFLRP